MLYWKFCSFGQQYLQSFQKIYTDRRANADTNAADTRVYTCKYKRRRFEIRVQLNGQIKSFPRETVFRLYAQLPFFHRIRTFKVFSCEAPPHSSHSPTPATSPLLPLPHSTFRCQPFSFFDENTGFFPLLFFFEFKTHSKERLNDQKFNFSSNIIEGCLFGEASYTCARVRIYTGHIRINVPFSFNSMTKLKVFLRAVFLVDARNYHLHTILILNFSSHSLYAFSYNLCYMVSKVGNSTGMLSKH